MIGTKFIKGNFIQEEYSNAAIWCNANNAHIGDKGEFYEVVANPIHIPTEEEIVAGYVKTVQNHLDTTAQTRNYDNIFTLCSYANDLEPNPKFLKEGRAAVSWRSAVWTKCYDILAEVKAGTRTVPTDIISELPTFTWGD